MKSKQKQEMKNLTEQELRTRLEQDEEKLFNLCVQHRFAPLKNPLQIRHLRKDVARTKTYLREKSNKKV